MKTKHFFIAVLILTFSQAIFAQSIKNESKNRFVADYVRKGLSDDIHSIEVLAKDALNISVDFKKFTITIKDTTGDTNGSYSSIDKKIVVATKRDNSLLSVRQTLIHELGHHVFSTFMLLKSPAERELQELTKLVTSKMPESMTEEEMKKWFEEQEKLIKKQSVLKNLIIPFDELFADYVRVLVLEEPGVKSYRDFSRLSYSINTEDFKSHHNVFNPVRARVWSRSLKHIVGNHAESADFLRVSGAMILRRIEINYRNFSQDINFEVDWTREILFLGNL